MRRGLIFSCLLRARICGLAKTVYAVGREDPAGSSLRVTRKSHDTFRHSVRRFGYTAVANVAHTLSEAAFDSTRSRQSLAAGRAPGGWSGGPRPAAHRRQ